MPLAVFTFCHHIIDEDCYYHCWSPLLVRFFVRSIVSLTNFRLLPRSYSFPSCL
ncbi:hypothetical protein CGRA01v4_12676 [Colletotrichum graminicola]|nr:hypothetical protein CGRA01v4_12676 [Colletotrichum graminicola]